MLALANELDKQGTSFIWFIFTTDEYNNNPVWNNKNIVHLQNRLDLGRYIKMANWLVQPSEVEGDSYTLKEALYRGIPIVACELPYFKEIGIENGKNALFLEKDCSNVEFIAREMKKALKFKFDAIKDRYDEIIANGKSKYQEELKKTVTVKCTHERGYLDIELNRFIDENEEFKTNIIRAEHLENIGLVTIVK